MTFDHSMNLVFSENTGEYLNKTSKDIIPSSRKERITELPEKSINSAITNSEED